MQIEASLEDLGKVVEYLKQTLPSNAIVFLRGDLASGKTTLTLHVIAEMQKLGGTAAFIDAEHALDPVYAKKLGVKTEELLISQPDTGEQALEIAERLRAALLEDAIEHRASPVNDFVTASIGVARIDYGASSSVGDLIKLADDGLYAAKGNGRNQVQVPPV